MKNLSLKLKQILLPLLFFTITFILFYSFLHWLIFIKFSVINWSEETTKFLVPALLLFILIPLFIWRKIKILTFKDLKAKIGFVLIFILYAIWPTAMAQNYLLTSTGKLTKLTKLSKVNELPKTRYYSIKNCFVANSKAVTQTSSKVSGKYNKNLTYNIYVALPMYNDSINLESKKVVSWLCFNYQETTDNKLPKIQKDAVFKELVKEVEADLDTFNFSKFNYLRMLYNSNEKDKYENLLKESDTMYDAKAIFFKSIYEPYEARNGNTLIWVFGVLAISSFVMGLILICFKIDERTTTTKWSNFF